MRRPLGTWPLALLRTVKGLHRVLRMAAEQFVFVPATPEQALRLQLALQLVLLELHQSGLVWGTGKDGLPEVSAQAVVIHREAALVAEVSAWLRPWVKRVDLRVTVRSGDAPRVEGL